MANNVQFSSPGLHVRSGRAIETTYVQRPFGLHQFPSPLERIGAIAKANPASVFCAKMQGRTVIVTLPDGGEIGLCYLPDKKIVEEWTLFRMFDGQKPAARNNPFK